MNVICLEDAAFYKLIDKVVEHIQKQKGIKEEDWDWVWTEEAMKMLGITSKTTLQKLRDENKIRYAPSTKKNFVYSRKSIASYLEKNSNK